ncbi:MAG TPA: peptide-methionine (S)-S-oxide reductase MsrA [Caulobacteraceae bacterium]|jgi:peptide-methionine (S)-S-oxide reductase|nr:peptide-methionine (S)-S-oxide reductase MsrA [Caulobacteraceae bacterium]
MGSAVRHLLIALAAAFALVAPAGAFAAPPQTAVFAGGCFWCMEHDMQAIPGVLSVESGYTGGTLKNPTYQDVITERTGHYESVRVKFDPDKITYRALLDRYWKLVDPTDDGGQFCDRGPSYRTAVFVNGPEQRKIAEETRAAAAKRLKSGKMTTQILPLGAYWPAEEYHRDFAKKNAEHYTNYRAGCGRDRRLAQVWGAAG